MVFCDSIDSLLIYFGKLTSSQPISTKITEHVLARKRRTRKQQNIPYFVRKAMTGPHDTKFRDEKFQPIITGISDFLRSATHQKRLRFIFYFFDQDGSSIQSKKRLDPARASRLRVLCEVNVVDAISFLLVICYDHFAYKWRQTQIQIQNANGHQSALLADGYPR
jgi:hypothetical protein